jgi:hypothetical protein
LEEKATQVYDQDLEVQEYHKYLEKVRGYFSEFTGPGSTHICEVAQSVSLTKTAVICTVGYMTLSGDRWTGEGYTLSLPSDSVFGKTPEEILKHDQHFHDGVVKAKANLVATLLECNKVKNAIDLYKGVTGCTTPDLLTALEVANTLVAGASNEVEAAKDLRDKMIWLVRTEIETKEVP